LNQHQSILFQRGKTASSIDGFELGEPGEFKRRSATRGFVVPDPRDDSRGYHQTSLREI
jgi:hypothetical protein